MSSAELGCLRSTYRRAIPQTLSQYLVLCMNCYQRTTLKVLICLLLKHPEEQNWLTQMNPNLGLPLLRILILSILGC